MEKLGYSVVTKLPNSDDTMLKTEAGDDLTYFYCKK
jgi:hypothetical protein